MLGVKWGNGTNLSRREGGLGEHGVFWVIFLFFPLYWIKDLSEKNSGGLPVQK